MKKLILPALLFLIYLVFLAGGFFAASTTAPEQIIKTTDVFVSQSGWLFIRVDDMEKEKPQLVSIWAMFIAFTQPPQVYFKPIYAAGLETGVALNFQRAFGVTEQRAISPKFLTELDKLNFKRDVMLIIDDEGFQAFSSWFFPPIGSSGNSKSTPFAPSDIKTYQQICFVLQSPIGANPTPLPWNKLSRDHFLSHPNIPSVTAIWDQLSLSGSPANCKVLPLN